MAYVPDPSLTVMAGPNGSGKSSMYRFARLSRLAPKAPFINADIIAQEEFGDWNSPEAQRKASIRAGRRRENFIQNKESFMYETILTRMDFIERAKQNGFFVQMFYVSTEDPTINIKRIAQRVADGGHHIPNHHVVKRYGESLAVACEAFKHIDRAFVYDNSITGLAFPRLLFRTRNGIVRAIYDTNLPPWASRMLNQLPQDLVEKST